MATDGVKRCAGCKNLINNGKVLICSKCKANYEIECVNIGLEQFNEMNNKNSWKCPDCCSKQPKVGNTNTPVRQTSSYTSSCQISELSPELSGVTTRKKLNKPQGTKISGDSCGPVTESRLREIIKEEISVSINALVTSKLNAINEQMTSFVDSLSFINVQYEEIKTMMEEKTATIDQLRKDNEHLKSSMRELNNKLNIVEMHMRESNVEINGIPEHKSENLVNTVLQLGKVVSHQLSTEDVQCVTRVAKLNKNNDRPRSVVVKLRSARQRDELLAAVVNFNKANVGDKLSSHHLGIGGAKKPVFVSEHLTPTNKSLHAAARIKAKQMNYRFTWVRNGRVYVRRDEFSQAMLIKNEECLKLIN
ncbi:unnamed protein product [Euphydryas editha]|uniref:FP protein C-terminal domain-containing protein n=1 Tax=Euphydryas editha TaxID=104508 RepID=A0AAU9UFT3_EUPED|nr:unnamed protein product [Euphydryas editha]